MSTEGIFKKESEIVSKVRVELRVIFNTSSTIFICCFVFKTHTMQGRVCLN